MMTIVLSARYRILIVRKITPDSQRSHQDRADKAHIPSSRTNIINNYILCIYNGNVP